MFDIIFLSYDEPNADKNFELLLSRFPHAKHLSGVKGIGQAHFAASKISDTSMFYVVDGDAEIVDSFDFSYKPPSDKKDYVHIWQARNPAIDIVYGYGGVKLFHSSFFKKLGDYVDFSTSLTKDVQYIDEISCVTRFNSDAFRSFRGAYRETTKLMLSLRTNNFINDQHKQQVESYLAAWKNPAEDANFREHIMNGVKNAIADFTFNLEKTHFINNFDFLEIRFKQCSIH